MRGCQTSGAGCIASAMIEMTGAATSMAVATAIAAAIRPVCVVRLTPAHVGRKPTSPCSNMPSPGEGEGMLAEMSFVGGQRSIVKADLVHQR